MSNSVKKYTKPKFLKQHEVDYDICPVCGADIGGYDGPGGHTTAEDTGDQCSVWGSCEVCGASWIDVYTRSNTIVVEPEGMRDDL